ncbi:sensor histidine kinase RegB [Litorisediminicola beolgyonensis]|uniref:histidine kinase n=1 Tax=Litorisediminicola beolgyonensis TaxID=1173614 RepID=A0ABW3ZLQ4_9RHOB
MTQATETGLLDSDRRGGWIRLRTMILLRWFAIAGQTAALVVATQVYHLQIEIGLAALAVGVSVIGNLVAIFIFPETKRLSESENLLMVLFDLMQLCFLLFLTGGLNNPFVLLVLAPVTVSAAVLGLRSIVLLNLVAGALVTALVSLHLPLMTATGEVLRMPGIFLFGQWCALMIALVFISIYARRLTREIQTMSDAVAATQMALDRAQKLNDLGGVVAAAAHELGTPLATIKLTSAELMDELDDRPDLREDAALIRAQADRCRDILRSMGRAGKDDLTLRQAPLGEVLREAAEPHEDRGKTVLYEMGPAPEADPDQPHLQRRPEVIHGLRNLVQNAVDFAAATVWIDAEWSASHVSVRIADDGPGFPPHLMGRIGDPSLRRRRSAQDKRPGYEGMGLGLFIAKTLLERSGAELSFANGSDPAQPETAARVRRGALVEVVWPRATIEAEPGAARRALGDNRPIEG